MFSRRAVMVPACLSLVIGCAEPTPPSLTESQAPVFARGGEPGREGEQQPVAEADRGTWAIYPPGQGQILAQTFTLASTHLLQFLELPVGCASADVRLNVKIREGLGGPILFATDVAGLPVVVDGTFYQIRIFHPSGSRRGIVLRPGVEYAFELAASADPGAAEPTCGLAQGPVGDSYPRGRGYYQDPINGPDFLPMPTGLATDDEDLPFVTRTGGPGHAASASRH